MGSISNGCENVFETEQGRILETGNNIGWNLERSGDETRNRKQDKDLGCKYRIRKLSEAFVWNGMSWAESELRRIYDTSGKILDGSHSNWALNDLERIKIVIWNGTRITNTAGKDLEELVLNETRNKNAAAKGTLLR